MQTRENAHLDVAELWNIEMRIAMMYNPTNRQYIRDADATAAAELNLINGFPLVAYISSATVRKIANFFQSFLSRNISFHFNGIRFSGGIQREDGEKMKRKNKTENTLFKWCDDLDNEREFIFKILQLAIYIFVSRFIFLLQNFFTPFANQM